MAGFAEQTLDERIYGLAGRPAEQAFLTVMENEGKRAKVLRFGYDQVDTGLALVASFSPLLRHAPDFIQAGGHMWEVQGCGEDRTFTFKREKLAALWRWHCLLRADNRELRWALFVQPDNVLIRATTEHVLWACQQCGEFSEQVVDDKAGWRVPVSAFEYGRVSNLGDAFRAVKRTEGDDGA